LERNEKLKKFLEHAEDDLEDSASGEKLRLLGALLLMTLPYILYQTPVFGC